MKNKLDQLVEAMIVLKKIEDDIQRTTYIENVIPSQENGLAQPQPERIPVEDTAI